MPPKGASNVHWPKASMKAAEPSVPAKFWKRSVGSHEKDAVESMPSVSG